MTNMSAFDEIITAGLNDGQREVVMHGNGPALVIAGAGSGKTNSLTRRTAKLIMDGVRPDAILLLTFTNKAAKEMMSRVERILNVQGLSIQGGTFHGYAYKQIMRYSSYLYPDIFEAGSYKAKQILDASDAEKLMTACIAQEMLQRGIDKEEKGDYKASMVASIVSYTKNTLSDFEEVIREDRELTDRQKEVFISAANAYEDIKHRNLYYDFDDILIDYLRLLMIDNIREAACGFARQIMIDEYQDTNPLQCALVNEMYKVTNNLLVVGDDAQSIYAFRGADYKNILAFPNMFPDVKMIMLTVNYRSTQNILDIGNEVVESMANKFEKQLSAANEGHGSILLWEPRTSYEQADNVVRLIRYQRQQGVPYDKMAILARSAMHTMEIESALLNSRIPYVKWGGIRFFDKAHIKDFIAIMRVKLSRHDKLAALRVFGMIPGVGAKSAEKMFEELSNNTLGTFLGKKKKFDYGPLIMDLVAPIQESDPQNQVFDDIISLYRDLCQKNYKEDYAERLTEVADLKTVLNTAASYQEFVALTALASAGDNTTDNSVVVSTIHAVKGLEFDTVILAHLAEGCLPFARAETPDELEEEKRLFYVAVTRAEKTLVLSSPRSIQMFGSTNVVSPSEFLTRAIANKCKRKLLPD